MADPKGQPRLAAPETGAERRKFIKALGKYAAVTPPAFVAMLSAAAVPAHAKGSSMGGGKGKKGGKGGHGHRRGHRRGRRGSPKAGGH